MMSRIGPATGPDLVRALVLAGVAVGVAAGLALVSVQSAAGVDPTPGPPSGAASSFPGATPSAGVTPSPAATQVVLSVPLASASPTPAPLLPVPAVPALLAHPSDGQANKCFECHVALDVKQRTVAQQWQASVHGKNGIGCADCHGGDPRSDEITVAMSKSAGFVDKPTRSTSVGICGGCHSDPNRMQQYGLPTDQFTKYYSSVHGQRLLVKDSRVAICIDCHGSHDVKKASDPTADVYPLNVPKLCSSCHADAKLMGSYGIPTDQYALYQKSIHGQQLLEKQDIRAPTCASCHGSHDAKPPVATTIVQICGQCHTATQALYEQSRHAKIGGVGPICVTCHGGHDVVLPDESRFFHPTAPQYECTTCHDPATRDLRLLSERFTKDSDRRCDTCHHSDSTLYAQAQGIHTALDTANAAYELAKSKIDEAAGLGMIVTDADLQLTEAKTNLIKARAAVHTTQLGVIAAIAGQAVTKASAAAGVADAKLEQSVFRREAMVVVVGVILVNVLALYVLKRSLAAHRRRSRRG